MIGERYNEEGGVAYNTEKAEIMGIEDSPLNTKVTVAESRDAA